MNKLLIAAVVGALSTSGMFAATSALAATPESGASSTAAKPKVRRPAPARRLIKRKPVAEAALKTDPIPDGAVKWDCKEGMTFFLKGDMKRDQIVTVNWDRKNYQLPRETTTTGADRFHDAATGMDLVVIPTKAMLFSDKDSSRLADECKTPEMAAMGTPAPTQANELIKNAK